METNALPPHLTATVIYDDHSANQRISFTPHLFTISQLVLGGTDDFVYKNTTLLGSTVVRHCK